MTSGAAFLVVSAPLAFGIAALAALGQPGRDPHMVKRVATAASWIGVVVAAAFGVAVAIGGTTSSPTLGVRGLGVSVRLDPLSTVMLLMVALLSVVIVRFSCTYLDGDARHGVFLGRLALSFAAVEVLVVAGNLALLIVAWVGTSLALHRLLLFYPDRRGAVVAARKKFVAARVGDVALIGAAALLYQQFSTGDLGKIFASVTAMPAGGWRFGAVEAAALLLVVTAMLKSAQFPTHGWLVEVMETPTPVSALLHAGILNAGPFLALRMAYVLESSDIATTALIVVGGFTAVFASVVLLTQPSVKVALGYSSAAHMGFMLMVCGLGVYPAVLLHLVAHSFYKAHAFLSSGSVIDERLAAGVPVPRRLGSPWRLAVSALVALGIYGALAAVWGVELIDEPVLLAVGAILVLGTTQLVGPAVDSTGPLSGSLRAAGLAFVVTLSFFTLEGGAHHLLGTTVPGVGSRTVVHGVLVTAMVLAFAVVILFQLIEPSRGSTRMRRSLALHLRNGCYANAAFDRLVGSLRIGGPHV